MIEATSLLFLLSFLSICFSFVLFIWQVPKWTGFSKFFQRNAPALFQAQMENRDYMLEIIDEGIDAFIKRVFSSTAQVIIYLFIVLFVLSLVFKQSFSWLQMIMFFIGAIVMMIGYIGCLLLMRRLMPVLFTVKLPVRESLIQAIFSVAMIMSTFLSGLSTLGLAFCIRFFPAHGIIGFGLGIILTSYFFMIGGSIYKSASDISRLVIKQTDPDRPKDETRNPSTLLDIIGDSVRRIFGFSSDLFSSFMLALISAILFSFTLSKMGYVDPIAAVKLQQLPIFIICVSLVASIISYGFAMIRIRFRPTNILLESIYLSVFICATSTFFIIRFFDIQFDIQTLWGSSKYYSLFLPYLLGLIGAIFLGMSTEFITSNRFRWVKQIARESEFGTTLSILNGLSGGLKSTGILLFVWLIVLVPAFFFAGFYGLALAALGMMSITPTMLTANFFAPLASNLHHIIQLDDPDHPISKHSLAINALGRTTESMGNGFASCIAVISCISILFSLILLSQHRAASPMLLVLNKHLFFGLLIGIPLPFIFSGFLLRGLNKTIIAVQQEVKRQFRDIAYLFEGKVHPDIIKASDYTTYRAMNALAISTALMVLFPIGLHFLDGSNSISRLIGFVFGTILSSGTLSYYWANVGDGLNQTKHYIKNGHFGGPESPPFAHISSADGVGDAMKDLLSPGLNIYMKVIGILTLLMLYFN